MGRLGLLWINCRQLLRTYRRAQGTLLTVLWWPKWEGNPKKRGYVYALSVQFSRSVVSDSETPWIAARQASLSITNSWSSLRLASIESVMPSSYLILCFTFSSCPQSLPASGSFPMSQLFATGGQSTGASASVLPMNIQGWFTLGLTGLISLFVFFLQNYMFMTRVDS